jgi:glycine/D-amino acid oxidase-like deaminating enzyme/nitrite reductase/ring-hydroxylating ferredoxin subunit
MKAESGNTVPYWVEGVDVASFGPLSGEIETDVCIIGGGIAGLTTAYLLAKEGKRVVVLDDGPIAGGETQRTTAHLSCVIDDRFYTVKSEHGVEKAKMAYESHLGAIEQIEQIVKDEGIDCDFVRLDGYLFRSEKKSHLKELQKEFDVASEIGFEGIEMLDTVPLEFFPEPREAIRFPRQGQFHVLKYLNGVASAVLRDGGKIYSGSHAEEIKDGESVTVKCSGGAVVRARFVVIATNSPVLGKWTLIHTKQSPYRTYVVAGRVPVGSVPSGLYWDTEDPYHYIRCQKIDGDDQNDLLIIGGEDHRTGEESDPASCFDELEKWARRMFPVMKSVDYRWSGQVMETVDGLGLIGRDIKRGENVFIATGDSGMGMTHGTLAGIILTDMILGRANPWAELYDPARVPLKAALEYVYENANTAAQYARYMQPAEVDSLSEIAEGEGALMRHLGKPYAVYREVGCTETTQCSAICPHLGAVVQWNDLEKSWDCPAHGSRFKATGEVVNGPASTGLAAIDRDKRIPEDDEAGMNDMPPPGDSGIELPPPPTM